MNLSLKRFETPALLEEALEELLREALASGGETGDFALILSGGRTPLPVYRRLAEAPGRMAAGAHVLMSDERHVPADDPANNARQFEPAWRAGGMPPAHFLRVDTSLDLEDSARRFEEALRVWLDGGMRIPLAMPGIGPDGHTASLFTEEDFRRGAGRLAIPVRRPEPPHRVSLTPSVLALAERVVVPVTGADKAGVLRELMTRPDALVCGRVFGAMKAVEVWADAGAAGKP